MLMSTRGTVRHPKFSECVRVLSLREPIVERIIDGAIWEIQRDPRGIGVYIKEIDVCQARLVLPSPPDLLLMYCMNSRYVTMLTIIPADGSKLL